MKRGTARGDRARGQSTVEYAILLAIVISAFIAIQFFVKQAAMGRMRSVTDQQIGRQWDPYSAFGKVTTTTSINEKQNLLVTGESKTELTGEEKNIRSAENEGVGEITIRDLFVP